MHRITARIALGLMVAAGAASLAPCASAASSLTSLRVTNGDLVVDKTATLALSGFSDPTDNDRDIQIDVNSPSLPCAATERLNDERRVDSSGRDSVAKGQFTDAMLNWMPKRPGNYVLCGWLFEPWPFTATTFAAISIPVTVRQPNTSLEFTLPASRLDAGATVPLSLRVYAEVTRHYSVEVNAFGVPCGPNEAANNAVTDWVYDNRITGGPESVIENVTVPDAGHYHLCGYVGTAPDDSTPTTVASGPAFWSGKPSCRFGGAPRRPSGTVELTCSNTDGPIVLKASRGRKQFTTAVALSGGKALIRGRSIGLKRHKRVTVTAFADGMKAGSRILRVR